MKPRSLKPEDLRWKCPEETLGFRITTELSPTGAIVGQERAVKALRLGLEIPSMGYNMFVTGISGTGRESTVKKILDSIDTTTDQLRDILYVHNMEDAQSPIALTFPAGGGARFVETLEECVQLLKSNIRAVLGSERADIERRALQKGFQDRKRSIMEALEKKAAKVGFTIVSIPVSPTESRTELLPIIKDEPVTFETLEEMKGKGELTAKDIKRFTQLHEKLFADLTTAFRTVQDLEIEANGSLVRMQVQLVRPTVQGILSSLRQIGDDRADAWTASVTEVILNNLKDFAETSEDKDPYLLLEPNLVLDNSGKTKRPVVIEEFPDPSSVFGNIDRIMLEGKPFSDHTMIRIGAIQQADGGYLIMNALDVVRQPGLWQQLIQTLRNHTTVIRNLDPLGLYPVNLHPEPIDINVKVILIGSSWLYTLLAENEPEFGLLFRIRAAFDYAMDLSDNNIRDFALVIAEIIRSENLPPMTAAAVALIAEESVRIAGRRDRISVEFNRVTDYIRQAAFYAKQDGEAVVDSSHVRKAILEKIRRLNLGETNATRQILDGTVMVDTEGEAVGQVNGLAVYAGVDYSFGLPARITARVSAGREGLINVERESDMSGETHTKGMLIIAGFMRGKFAREYPLSLAASIVFEQSYGGVDGDSASSTELYALLSALSEAPIRQDLAVTGSVNQFGRIQAIGGVNHKVEGFFRVCNGRGLTGSQGVLVPASNVSDLQLRGEVLDAVAEGRFHIYAVECLEEGIELLMGMKAGEPLPDGKYPADTVYGKVDRRLRQMAETLRAFSFRD
jgi:lon-related putative ATP-dependent protease